MISASARGIQLPHSNRYEFQKPLGNGGMSTVYRAYDRRTDSLVAIKVLSYKSSESPVLHKRIEREFRAATELDHPNIVRALAFETDGEVDYLVYELVEGSSLGERLEQRGRLTESEAVRIVAQIVQALDYAHSRGVVHRDVKPDNILVLHDGRAKLTDFGLAKMHDSVEDNLTRPLSSLGTPQYMAPEQYADAKTADLRSDVYSLGGTLYSLVTGRLPFDGKTPVAILTQKSFERYPSARSLVPGLSERLDAAIAAALKPNPELRPATCLAFHKLLMTRRPRKVKPGNPSDSTVQINERRAWVRHPVGAGTSGGIDPGIHPGGDVEQWPLLIRDLSEGGIGLLFGRRFEPDTELIVEFPGEPHDPIRKRVRVIRVQPEFSGHWVHGCVFLDSLSEQEFAEFAKLV